MSKAEGVKAETFEAALQRLECIVREMEEGKVDLDSMLRFFEEGQELVKFCNGKLKDVERKIKKLTKTENGIEALEMDVEKDVE